MEEGRMERRMEKEGIERKEERKHLRKEGIHIYITKVLQ